MTPLVYVGDFGDKPYVVRTGADLSDSGLALFLEIVKPTTLFASVLLERAGAFTDVTSKARDTRIKGDVELLSPDGISIGDAIYFGSPFRFGCVFLDIDEPGTGSWGQDWEFSEGVGVWGGLSVVDDTGDFRLRDPVTYKLPAVSFVMPTTWVRSVVNGSNPYYFVRARITVPDPAPVVAPTATQIRIGPVELGGAIISPAVNGDFAVVLPEGVFDESGRYRFQSRLESTSPLGLVRGQVMEIEVKERGNI